jgi:hypothetical protein
VVGSQPFGGEGLSGTGPKAGGPDYLARFTARPAPGNGHARRPRPRRRRHAAWLPHRRPRPRQPKPARSHRRIEPAAPGIPARRPLPRSRRGGGTGPGRGQVRPSAATRSRPPTCHRPRWAAGGLFRRPVVGRAEAEAARARRCPPRRSDPAADRGAARPRPCSIERHACIDTTASGGNARLLAAATTEGGEAIARLPPQAFFIFCGWRCAPWMAMSPDEGRCPSSSPGYFRRNSPSVRFKYPGGFGGLAPHQPRRRHCRRREERLRRQALASPAVGVARGVDRGRGMRKPAPMFPIRDHNPSGRTPYVTLALIAINVLVFLAYYPRRRRLSELDRFYWAWGLVPARIMAGGATRPDHPHVPAWRLDAPRRQHAVSVDLRRQSRRRDGPCRLLAFYLAAGLVAAGLQVLADPYSPAPMVGASGAIAGVMGGYLLLFPGRGSMCW